MNTSLEHVYRAKQSLSLFKWIKSHVRRRHIHTQFHTGNLSHRGVLLAQGARLGREGPRGATRVTVTALVSRVDWCRLLSAESLCFCVKQLGRHSQTGGSRRLMVSKSVDRNSQRVQTVSGAHASVSCRGARVLAPRLKLSV